MAAATPSLNCDWRKMVTGFPVWTICIVSSMIASWFSIARKCEELPLQRDVCPTSTNPQLMASRSNRPQQPHILQRIHVHNSFARLKKKKKSPTLGKTVKQNVYLLLMMKIWEYLIWRKKAFQIFQLRQDDCCKTPLLLFLYIKKGVVIISDNFPCGRAEVVGEVCFSDSEKQAQHSLVASSLTNRP